MPQQENITTKFKVDISDLKKGISDANQQIKLANASFKAASAGMDDWQKSTDGVKAKLSQLDSVLAAEKSKLAAYVEQLNRQKTAYEENGKRAEELRARLEELASQGVSKTSTEYKALQTELKNCEKEQASNEKAINNLNVQILNQEAAVGKTEREIRTYSGQLDELERDQGDAEKSSHELGEELEDTGKKAEQSSEGFTVMKGILADLAASAIKAAVEGLRDLADAAYDAWKAYDSGADTIIAATGATGEQADALIGSMETVAHRVVADMDEIGTAIGEVNTRFGFTGEQLEDTSELFLKFAQLNGTDVKSSVDTVQQAMAAWGIEAENVGDVLDVLNKAGQDTGESVDEIAGSLSSNAAALQEMGLEFIDATTLLANFGKNGVEASDVMTGMRKAMVNASKEGKPLTAAMQDIEDAIKGATTSTEAITIASELFGTRAGPAIATAVRDGRLSFEDMGEAIGDVTGNINETFEEMMDTPDRIALAFQGFKVEIAKIFDELLQEYGPAIESAISTLTTTVLPALVGMIRNLIAAVASFTREHGPAISAAFETLSRDILPVLITVLKTVIDIVVKTFGALAEGIGAFMREHGAALRAALETFSDKILPAVVKAIEIVIAIISDLVGAVVVLFEGIQQMAQGFVDAWQQATDTWDEAVQYFTDIWNGIKSALSAVPSWFKSKFQAAWNGVKNAWSGAKGFFSNIWSNIKQTYAPANSWFREKFKAAWVAITVVWNVAKPYFSGIYTSIQNTFNGVADWFGSKFQEAWDNITDAFSGWVDYWSGLWQSIQDIFTGLGTRIGDAIGASVKAGINSVIAGAERVINSGISLINDAIDLINMIPGVDVDYVDDVSFPRLAKGGVLKRGQVGLLEGSGAEAVVPLDQNKAWIHAVAEDLREEMQVQYALPGSSTTTNSTNFTQIINAPKQPSRIELYRQTRNLLALAGGAASV